MFKKLRQLAWAHDQSSRIHEILEAENIPYVSLGSWLEHDDGTIEVLSGEGPNGEPTGYEGLPNVQG